MSLVPPEATNLLRGLHFIMGLSVEPGRLDREPGTTGPGNCCRDSLEAAKLKDCTITMARSI